MTQRKHHKIIGFFGSSFNPPHLGHYEVIKEILAQGQMDEIWLVPVNSHAFGKDLLDFNKRLQLVQALKQDLNDDRVKISTIENDLDLQPSYTVDVIEVLRDKCAGHEFQIIVGSDAKNDLPKWHRIDDLKKVASFYFVPRAGFEQSPFADVSSTQIRSKLAQNESVADLVSPAVNEVLIKNNWYR